MEPGVGRRSARGEQRVPRSEKKRTNPVVNPKIHRLVPFLRILIFD
jgi:hypothetical protein